MKAGDLQMVEYCAEHKAFRVLPLQTCVDLARQSLVKGEPHGWVVVGFAATYGEAQKQLMEMKS